MAIPDDIKSRFIRITIPPLTSVAFSYVGMLSPENSDISYASCRPYYTAAFIAFFFAVGIENGARVYLTGSNTNFSMRTATTTIDTIEYRSSDNTIFNPFAETEDVFLWAVTTFDNYAFTSVRSGASVPNQLTENHLYFEYTD